MCFCNDTAPTEIYTDLHTLSLHDAPPIYRGIEPLAVRPNAVAHHRDELRIGIAADPGRAIGGDVGRIKRAEGQHEGTSAGEGSSEEHTSELQSLMRSSYAVFSLNKTNVGPD